MSLRNEYLKFGFKLALGIGLLVAAFHVIEFNSVASAIATLNPLVYLVALATAVVGGVVVPAVITSRMLAVGGLRISLLELVKINFAMRFYVLTLPHVVTVGMRWHRYQQAQKGKGWQVAAMLVFERAAQLVAVVTLAFVFLLFSYPALPASLHSLIPASALLAGLGICVILLFVSRRVFSIVLPAINFFVVRTPRVMAGRIERLAKAVGEFQGFGNGNVMFVLGWQVVWHILLVFTAYVFCRGLGMDIGFADLGWIRSVVLMLTILPITVGGLGVREVAFTVLLMLHGVSESLALALPILLLSTQLLIGFAGAALETARVLRQVKRT